MCSPLAFITALFLLCIEFTNALIFLTGMFSHSSSNAVRNCPRVLGCSDVFLRACPVRPTNAQLGTNVVCTVASRVVQCCCLPESLGKLWLHEDGHYHAGKSFDAVALTELRQDEGSHLCTLPLLGSREQQSMRLHTMRNPSPYHNRPSPISIPLENASVGKPLPTTSVKTTSPVSTKKGEPGLICEENTSTLPHWKTSRSLCCHPSHTTRATCPIEWQTDGRTTGS